MTAGMILAAGHGTRLRPITESFPKPLVPIGDRASFLHVVERFRAAGLAPIVMNAHHRSEAFSGVLPPDVKLSLETALLGTGGGVRHAHDVLGAGDVVVWNGDIFAPDIDLRDLLRVHRRHQDAVATLVVGPPGRSGTRGTVGISSDGCIARLRSFSSGDEERSADYLGVMVVSARARALLPQEGCLVGDWLIPMLENGARAAVYDFPGEWHDIGTPAALLKANLSWLARNRKSSWMASDARCQASVELQQTIVGPRAAATGTGLLDQCLLLPGAELRAPAAHVIALPDGRTLRVGDA